MLYAKGSIYFIKPWQAQRVMSIMVWAALLLLLLWAGPTFQNKKTKGTSAYKVSSGHALPLHAYSSVEKPGPQWSRGDRGLDHLGRPREEGLEDTDHVQ